MIYYEDNLHRHPLWDTHPFNKFLDLYPRQPLCKSSSFRLPHVPHPNTPPHSPAPCDPLQRPPNSALLPATTMQRPHLPLTIPPSPHPMTVMSHQHQYDLPHQSDLGLVNQPKPKPNLDPPLPLRHPPGVDPSYLMNYMQIGTLGNLGKKSNSST